MMENTLSLLQIIKVAKIISSFSDIGDIHVGILQSLPTY